MRKFLLALALCLAPTLAFAQCSGVFPASNVCGTTSAGANVPGALPLSSFALAPGGVSGNVQTNNGSGGLAGITNTQLTALLNNFTSLLSGTVPASGGGAASWLRADGTWTNALIGTSNGGSELAISVLDAGMVNTNHLLHKVGLANSTNNVAEWGFGVGSATLNNFWFLGMFGNDCQVKGDGNGFVGIGFSCTAVLDKAFAVGSDSNFSVDSSGNVTIGGTLNVAGLTTLAFGTAGTNSVINATSGNTGAGNFFVVNNSGTISTSNTSTIIQANLSNGTNAGVSMVANGGATPSAQLTSGPGLTGGMTIFTQAGTLTIAAPSITGVATVASATVTPAGGSTAARLIFGTTSGFGIYYGSGAPTVSAAQGSLYLRSDGTGASSRAYINTTGSTTWTPIATGS